MLLVVEPKVILLITVVLPKLDVNMPPFNVIGIVMVGIAKSKVPPAFTVNWLVLKVELCKMSVPPLTIVGPVYVLALGNINVPPPNLVSANELIPSSMSPLKVNELPLFVTPTAASPFNVIAPLIVLFVPVLLSTMAPAPAAPVPVMENGFATLRLV